VSEPHDPHQGWREKTAQPKGRYCPDCGGALFFDYRGGERRPLCPACGFVRYRNPAVGVATIIRDPQGRVLLGRRAHGDYAGHWCIPCGYVEWDEDIRVAAVRECAEETGLQVELGPVIAVHSNFHNRDKQTVGVWFVANVVGGAVHPMDGEFTELGWFAPGQPPSPLAFPTDFLVLDQLATEAGPPR